LYRCGFACWVWCRAEDTAADAAATVALADIATLGQHTYIVTQCLLRAAAASHPRGRLLRPLIDSLQSRSLDRCGRLLPLLALPRHTLPRPAMSPPAVCYAPEPHQVTWLPRPPCPPVEHSRGCRHFHSVGINNCHNRILLLCRCCVAAVVLPCRRCHVAAMSLPCRCCLQRMLLQRLTLVLLMLLSYSLSV